MDLASMLEREDFFSSFFPSVEKYFREALKNDITFSFAANRKDCNMVIKPRLSAASSINMSKKAREFYYSEWNIRNSLLKYFIAKVYVFFMTRTRGIFSQFRFTIMPEPDNIRDIVIAPNNRSIRIFDYRNDVVGCVIKEGFTDKFFRNQITFRKNYCYDFILPILSCGDDWFQEVILHGHPLARITNEGLYQKAMNVAINNMRLLANDTLLYIDCNEYVLNLQQQIIQMTNVAETKKKIKYAKETHRIAEFAVREAMLFKKDIPTVMSHGDFQSGNIWVDQQEKVWIYDWETAGRRSIWYDTSVINYSLRRHYGWKKLMDIEAPCNMTLCEIDYSNYSIEQYRGIKGIVLLEDLVFYLEDMLELPENWGAALFDAFIKRIIEIEKVKRFR